MGKVIVAFMNNEARSDLLSNANLERFTEHTLTDAEALEERFGSIRERGYDLALDELDYGVVSLSVAISNRKGHVVAAINCSTTTTRVSPEELVRTRLPLLHEAKKEIETELKQWPALSSVLGERN